MIHAKQELDRFLIEHAREIRALGVQRIGVFGSFARGDQNPTSDVDLLVEFDVGRKTYRNFIDLAYFLQDRLGRRVELVTPEGLSRHVRAKILAQVEYVPFAA